MINKLADIIFWLGNSLLSPNKTLLRALRVLRG